MENDSSIINTKTDMTNNHNKENKTLQIKQEQLDIAKRWVQTGQVNIHREVISIDKNFTIPIKREELVIEKTLIKSTIPGFNDSSPEAIRIPLCEEHVEFSKHMVTLEDVSIYKHQIKEIMHIEETLKREEPKIKTTGAPRIIDESNFTHS